ERRGMPVGEALVEDSVDAWRLQRIGNVEDDAVAGARTGGDAEFGKHGNVVALVGAASFLGVVALVSAAPQSGDSALVGIGEHRGAVHDARSEEHTSELQSRENLVCRLLLE